MDREQAGRRQAAAEGHAEFAEPTTHWKRVRTQRARDHADLRRWHAVGEQPQDALRDVAHFIFGAGRVVLGPGRRRRSGRLHQRFGLRHRAAERAHEVGGEAPAPIRLIRRGRVAGQIDHHARAGLDERAQQAERLAGGVGEAMHQHAARLEMGAHQQGRLLLQITRPLHAVRLHSLRRGARCLHDGRVAFERVRR
jgi:hypothetical protein